MGGGGGGGHPTPLSVSGLVVPHPLQLACTVYETDIPGEELVGESAPALEGHTGNVLICWDPSGPFLPTPN